MIRQGRNCLALIHILEEVSARVALEQLAKTGYYTIRRGKLIGSGVQELKRTTEPLVEAYADGVDLILIMKQITETLNQKWQEYQKGFNINLEVDQRIEKEARHVSVIARQVEM